MAAEKKGITVKIDAELHAEVRQFLDSHEMTMAEFVTQAFQDELHPKLNIQEEKTMGNMRTLAFQVPEELFQKIKGYLQRNHITQKEFVIGLIENEIERDLTQRADHEEQPETAAVSESEDETEEVEEQHEEQESAAVSGDFEDVSNDESEETKDEELDDEAAEDEELGDEETEDEELDDEETADKELDDEETEDEELDDKETEDLDNEPSEDKESEDFDEDESESECQGMTMRV